VRAIALAIIATLGHLGPADFLDQLELVLDLARVVGRAAAGLRSVHCAAKDLVAQERLLANGEEEP
jgi:hypothetical protein